MEAAVDLHIHSALSPCADDDMTPNNIVNMALLNGLDAIAVTDHNCCDNVEAVTKAAGNKLIVLPGMELQTLEEVHLLCYFKDLTSLYDFRNHIEQFYDGMANHPSYFGHQWIMNERDEVIGSKEQALLASLLLSFDDAVELIRKFKGLPVPAHINKPSNSILSQLGFIPPESGLTLLEISHNYPLDYRQYPNCTFLVSSDAHFLGQILERKMLISVEEITKEQIFQFLSKSFI